MKIHVVAAHERSLLPELVDHVEEDDDRSGKICLEEAVGDLAAAQLSPPNGPDASPELGDQYKAVEDEADP